jgi:outer membrane protein
LPYRTRHLLVGTMVAAWATASAGQEFVPPLASPTAPNFVGLAVGMAPDYFGSADYFVGAAPVMRLQRDGTEQSVFLYGNAFGSNLVDHPWLRTGPSAVLRFGRSDVDDDVVDRMRDVDMSLDLGWQIGAEFIDPDNVARRARIDAYATHDVTGAHDGYVAGISASAWTPTPFFLLGVNASVSWGSDDYTGAYFGVDAVDSGRSGLPMFEAGEGLRDARIAAIALVPVTSRVIVGAGVIYSRLLGDAADSPIVSDRGDANQFIFGIGSAYSW